MWLVRKLSLANKDLYDVVHRKVPQGALHGCVPEIGGVGIGAAQTMCDAFNMRDYGKLNTDESIWSPLE